MSNFGNEYYFLEKGKKKSKKWGVSSPERVFTVSAARPGGDYGGEEANLTWVFAEGSLVRPGSFSRDDRVLNRPSQMREVFSQVPLEIRCIVPQLGPASTVKIP